MSTNCASPRGIPSGALEIHLQQARGRVFARCSEPCTVGVPLPKGAERDTAGWRLAAASGERLPLQARVLDRWSDGSIRWALLDFQADAVPGRSSVDLRFDGEPDEAAPGGERVAVSREGAAAKVSTGPAAFRFAPGSGTAFEAFPRSGDGPAAVNLRITGEAGRPARIEWRSVEVEEEGPVRACVRMEGEARLRGRARLALILRIHLFAGLPTVRLLLTIRNPRRAAHPGGYWELGDAGSVLIKEASLVVRPAGGAPPSAVRCSLEPGRPLERFDGFVHVYQDSSGGENWRSPNHVNRHGIVPNRFRGYRATYGGQVREGLRATPIVLAEFPGQTLGAAVSAFWQNFPRALEAGPAGVTVSFWPAEYADLHELQGGEQKTHECCLAFGDDRVTDLPLDWCREPLLAHLSPEWYSAAEAVAFLTPAAGDPNREYLQLVNAAIEGDDTFIHKRERVDEYGWRHFGEIYGDHEAVRHAGPEPLVSHYNNQYDPVLGFACQFMRTGDARWWTQCEELAAHVVDIDIYHTTEDKAAYNQGLFWHTVHYIDAGRATHRSYPKSPGSPGGGPASEQNYTTGLMLRYFMTGDAAAREAAIGLARFVVDMDDGSKTVFRWLDRGPTGLATQSGSPYYHGPGRGSGNSLNALVDGHRLTGDAALQRKAVEIIRRAVSPSQEIGGLQLGDVERRWFYTMFLQALGKYLDHKAERGEEDADYAYAQASLLHFARWMAQHEYPYLDKPEILEFPTETWPAQDMRKSEVFRYAARYATGQDRERFVERARFFFDYSAKTLEGMRTRTLARPVVLLLSHGFAQAWFDRHPDAAAPRLDPPGQWPGPRRFVPQKVRAIRRAKILAVAGAAAAAFAAAAFLF